MAGAWGSAAGVSAAYQLASGTLASNSWTVFKTQAAWTSEGPVNGSITWGANGLVVPRTGRYLVDASLYVGAGIATAIAIKRNEGTASGAGAVVLSTQAIYAGSNLAGHSVSRVVQLAAADSLCVAFHTTGTAGPYGISAAGTAFSATFLG